MRRVLLPLAFSGQPAPRGGQIRHLGGHSMGTTWSVRVVEGGAAVHLQQGLQRRLDAVVAQMSHWDAASDLGRFNRAPAGCWQSLPAEFFDVLSFAAAVAEASDGACDPCAGALVNRWGFGPLGRHDEPGFAAPSDAEVAALVAARRGITLRLDAATRRALQPGGMQLDLSAVAKGYGVDCLARYLEGLGMRHYLVEVGGELRGAGTKPDGQPWWVALEQPGDAAAAATGLAAAADDGAASLAAAGAGASAGGAAPAAGAAGQTRAGQHGAVAAAVAPARADVGEMVLALHGLSVATSGDYRRYFTRGGRRFPHTIDPRDGMPISNGLASVSVVHAECMAADAWSTALTVLGPQAGLALAERHGLAARFLVRDGDGVTELLSSQLLRMLDDA